MDWVANNTDYDVYLWDMEIDDYINPDGATGDRPEYTSADLVPGKNYGIMVHGYSGTAGTYLIEFGM